MPQFALEYTLCNFQSGSISLAIRTHRRQGGNPELDITVGVGQVVFTLPDLLDGIPQALLGEPRDNHVDFYFLLDEFRRARSTFPTVAALPNSGILLPTVNPSGMERRGGKPIRMSLGGPIFRMPVEEVVVESVRAPIFRAQALRAELFADFETSPSRGLYSTELPEVHFGLNGEFTLVDASGVTGDLCRVIMTEEQYATWLDEVMGSI